MTLVIAVFLESSPPHINPRTFFIDGIQPLHILLELFVGHQDNMVSLLVRVKQAAEALAPLAAGAE